MGGTEARELAFLLTFDGMFNPEFSADELYELALLAGSPSDDEGIRDVFAADSMTELMKSASELSEFYSQKELDSYPDGKDHVSKDVPDSRFSDCLREFTFSITNVNFAVKLARESAVHAEEIDAEINTFSPKRPAHRLSKVNLAILRCAICEIEHFSKAKIPVIINDAVELAKKYGDDNDYKFINGLLGTYVRSLKK